MSNDKSKKNRKRLLWVSLFINLGFLGVFKYFNFFIDSFASFITLFGFQANLPTLQILLPVGISFYTFQTLSYTIDVYRQKLKPTKSLLDFCAYVAFFPQLVAGPIERASNLLPQFEKERVFRYDEARHGMRQILWGLFKKVVIADNCGIIVDSVFQDSNELGGGIMILGVLLFAIQIYCDFSGYSDIAIGTAKLLGFHLMQNFATPYFARDIAEFWRRWHISLSTWFRDYVYIPLGGSRGSKVLQLRNIFVIFLVSGLWHGANWTFIFWGLVHALMYIPFVLLDKNREHLNTVAEGRLLPSVKDFFKILSTFLIVCAAWVFFRADSLSHAFNYLSNMVDFSKDCSSYIKELDKDFLIIRITFFITILLIVEWINREGEYGLEYLPKYIILRYAVYFFISLLVIEYLSGQSSFIYFQF